MRITKTELNLANIQFYICKDVVECLLKQTPYTECSTSWSHMLQRWLSVAYVGVRLTDSGDHEFVGYNGSCVVPPVSGLQWFSFKLDPLIEERKFSEYAVKFAAMMRLQIYEDLLLVEPPVSRDVLKVFSNGGEVYGNLDKVDR